MTRDTVILLLAGVSFASLVAGTLLGIFRRGGGEHTYADSSAGRSGWLPRFPWLAASLLVLGGATGFASAAVATLTN